LTGAGIFVSLPPVNVLESPSLAHQSETPATQHPDAYELFLRALAVSDLLNRLFWPRRRKRPASDENDPFPSPPFHFARKVEKRLKSGVSL
jgi:hypothetical protein